MMGAKGIYDGLAGGSERAMDMAQEQKALTSSLLSVFFGLIPNLSTSQLSPTYVVLPKLV